MTRPTLPGRARWGVVLLPLVLAACSSGSGSGSGSPTTAGGGATQLSNGQLQGAGTTVLHQMDSYTSTSSKCTSATSPVVCVEAADRTLGGQIHTYANLLAVGHGFHAPGGDLSNARDAAQTLANSLEILGDAEPTQANYDQVLNTFNIASAIHSLQGDVTKLNGQLG